MANAALFFATVFIWGTTWIAITFQTDAASIVQAVFHRFAVAALVFMGVLAALGRLQRPKRWRFVILQALCLFSFNFLCFYKATTLIPSGLVSVVFACATFLNVINARVFFGNPIRAQAVIAALIGTTGLGLLFLEDITLGNRSDTIAGIGWAFMGTLLFSLGNMASRKNSLDGINPVQANAWGMAIGAGILLTIVYASGQKPTLPLSVPYLSALFYLAVIGSVLGFTTYLMLVARLGSDRAAYATVLFPVVALTLSTVFEGYQWQLVAMLGVALTLVGNLVMFVRLPRKNASPRPM